MPLSAGLGMKIYRYRSLIRRHWWIMAITVGVGLAIQGYMLFTKPQLFESTSQLIYREELTAGNGGPAASLQDLHAQERDGFAGCEE